MCDHRCNFLCSSFSNSAAFSFSALVTQCFSNYEYGYPGGRTNVSACDVLLHVLLSSLPLAGARGLRWVAPKRLP